MFRNLTDIRVHSPLHAISDSPSSNPVEDTVFKTTCIRHCPVSVLFLSSGRGTNYRHDGKTDKRSDIGICKMG